MVHIAAPDPVITCPLDESHRILKSRMQFHLVRCLKNNKLGMRLKCPWNPLHIIDKFAYEIHYREKCEDMPQACASLYKSEETRDVGSVPVNATNNLLLPADEDWDAQPGPVGTYDPTKNAEGKPVLRIAVGLSKAKRKQWRQAERQRFQMLEANGPLQVEKRPPEGSELPKTLRPPRNIGRALSKSASVADDLNSSKSSDETERKNGKGKKEPPTLRKPHQPSLALSYRANDPAPNPRNGARRKTSVSSDDDASMPNLRNSYDTSFYDTASRRSSASSQHSNYEFLRKTMEKNMRISGVNSSLHCLSETTTSALLDEAALSDLPNLVASCDGSDKDSVREISQMMAELTTEQLVLEGKTTALMQQMSMIDPVPNLVSSDGMSNASLSVVGDPPLTKQQTSLLGGISRCAANFPRLPRSSARPLPGLGRGIVIAEDSFRNNPGARRENLQHPASRAETNPFRNGDAASVGDMSQLTYTLSAGVADDRSSIYGFEDAD